MHIAQTQTWRAACRWAGFWRLADPKISLASMASIFLGVAVARHDGLLSPGWLLLTVFGIFCIEVAKNASGRRARVTSPRMICAYAWLAAAQRPSSASMSMPHTSAPSNAMLANRPSPQPTSRIGPGQS